MSIARTKRGSAHEQPLQAVAKTYNNKQRQTFSPFVRLESSASVSSSALTSLPTSPFSLLITGAVRCDQEVCGGSPSTGRRDETCIKHTNNKGHDKRLAALGNSNSR